MNKIKNIKKNKFLIFNTIFVCLSIVTYIADLLLKTNITFNLTSITSIMIGSTLTILGLWVSCYFLTIQLYKNKYPMDLIKDSLKKLYSRFISCISICFCVGMIYMFIGPQIISTIVYSINCVVSISFILFNTYKTIDDYSIRNLFSDYIKNINNEIKSDNTKTNEKKIEKDFNKLTKLYKESYRDNNYFICEEIIKSTSESFKDLVQVSGKLFSDDSSKNKDDTMKLVDEYIHFNIKQLHKALDCPDKSLFNYIIDYQCKNIKYCLEARQYDIYYNYIKALLTIIYLLNEHEDRIDRIYGILIDVCGKIIDENIDEKYLLAVLEFLDDIIKAKNFDSVNANIKSFYEFLFYLLRETINKDENEKYYTSVLDSIRKNVIHLSLVNKKFENTFISFLSYANFLILENKEFKYFEDFIDVYSEIEEHTSADSRWKNYHFALLSELIKKNPDKEMTLILSRADLVYTTISKNDSVEKIILPKIEIAKVVDFYGIGDNLDDVVDRLFRIIRISIVKENTFVIYKYIHELNECIKSIDKSKKDIQIQLICVYRKLIMYAAGLSKINELMLIFDEYKSVINDLDKEKNISEALTTNILDEALDMSSVCFSKSELLVGQNIDLLQEFLMDDTKVFFAIGREKYIIKKIYNIGLLCIENNNENLLRQVSNSIGWITLKSIEKNKNVDVYKYGIERAIDLYRLSKFMEISTKTKIFIMTLFTTIGSYCQSDKSLYIYGDKIIQTILRENKDIVKTAVELRTHENNMWEELMKNPKLYGDLFYNKFLKAQEKLPEKERSKINGQG